MPIWIEKKRNNCDMNDKGEHTKMEKHHQRHVSLFSSESEDSQLYAGYSSSSSSSSSLLLPLIPPHVCSFTSFSSSFYCCCCSSSSSCSSLLHLLIPPPQWVNASTVLFRLSLLHTLYFKNEFRLGPKSFSDATQFSCSHDIRRPKQF